MVIVTLLTDKEAEAQRSRVVCQAFGPRALDLHIVLPSRGLACGLQFLPGVMHPGKVASLAVGAQAEDGRPGWVSSAPSVWAQGQGSEGVGWWVRPRWSSSGAIRHPGAERGLGGMKPWELGLLQGEVYCLLPATTCRLV